MALRRVLYLADPNSVHDLKWIRLLSASNQVMLVTRRHHLIRLQVSQEEFANKYGIQILGAVDDFSTVWFWKSIVGMLKIRSIIKVNKIQLFHVLYAEPNALWGLFRGYFGIPMLLTTRGTDVLKTIPETIARHDFLNRTVSMLYRSAFGKFDAVTSTSSQQLRSIRDHDLYHGRLLLIRTGIETAQIDKSQAELPAVLGNCRFILFPRNMRLVYNHEFALEAIALLPDEIRDKYAMVFVNSDSFEESYVEGIKSLMQQIKANFVFLPTIPQETLWAMYKSAALVVMTPLSDGTPVSALEALYCGAKVIVPPLAYDSDVLGPNVFRFSAWDPHTLASLIVQVLQSQQTEALKEIRKMIREHADSRLEMSKLNTLYDTILRP